MTLRVAILVHGHVAHSAGGTESAAYGLFQRLKESGRVTPLLVAMGPPSSAQLAPEIAHHRGEPDQWIVSLSRLEGLSLSSVDPRPTRRLLERIASEFRPDLIHVHHFLGFGTQIFSQIKKIIRVPVVVTLHEYLAICHRDGQLVRSSGALCESSSPVDCAQCFPKIGGAAFFARDTWIASQLMLADSFIAPSRFLASRFQQWRGWRQRPVHVVENVMPIPAGHHLPMPRARAVGAKTRIGFFGRYTALKGIHVLLEAVELLSPEVRAALQIGLHGEAAHNQDAEFREHVRGMIARHAAVVHDNGRYLAPDAQALMHSYDWIVVPSVWWENSPMVIQEALAAGRPVICSALGGMLEKVSDGKAGVVFDRASPRDLARVLDEIVTGRIEPPVIDRRNQQTQALERHMDLYETMIARSAGDSANKKAP